MIAKKVVAISGEEYLRLKQKEAAYDAILTEQAAAEEATKAEESAVSVPDETETTTEGGTTEEG